MVADIMSGETDFADVMFLIGIVLAALAGIIRLVVRPPRDASAGVVATALLSFAVAAVAWGLLAL